MEHHFSLQWLLCIFFNTPWWKGILFLFQVLYFYLFYSKKVEILTKKLRCLFDLFSLVCGRLTGYSSTLVFPHFPCRAIIIEKNTSNFNHDYITCIYMLNKIFLKLINIFYFFPTVRCPGILQSPLGILITIAPLQLKDHLFVYTLI